MKYLILPLLVFLSSCGAKTVFINIQTHTPYCGGAKPTPEIAKGTTVPAERYKFSIFKEGETKAYKEMTMDADGMWSGKLKPGKYTILREDKTLSILEIKAKYKLSSSELYSYLGDACLEKWKLEPDFKLEVVDGTIEYKFTLNLPCFVGMRPCLKYEGPLVQ